MCTHAHIVHIRHTRARTYAYTHAHAHTQGDACPHTHAHVRAYRQTHVHTHTYTYVRTDIRIHTRTRMHIHTRTHVRTPTPTHIHTHPHTAMYSATSTHTRTPSSKCRKPMYPGPLTLAKSLVGEVQNASTQFTVNLFISAYFTLLHYILVNKKIRQVYVHCLADGPATARHVIYNTHIFLYYLFCCDMLLLDISCTL